MAFSLIVGGKGGLFGASGWRCQTCVPCLLGSSFSRAAPSVVPATGEWLTWSSPEWKGRRMQHRGIAAHLRTIGSSRLGFRVPVSYQPWELSVIPCQGGRSLLWLYDSMVPVSHCSPQAWVPSEIVAGPCSGSQQKCPKIMHPSFLPNHSLSFLSRLLQGFEWKAFDYNLLFRSALKKESQSGLLGV